MRPLHTFKHNKHKPNKKNKQIRLKVIFIQKVDIHKCFGRLNEHKRSINKIERYHSIWRVKRLRSLVLQTL